MLGIGAYAVLPSGEDGAWEIFEPRAHSYEGWYETRRGRRVDRAERAIVEWLLAPFPAARSVLEVGCGTAHFTRWLAARDLIAIGLDRSPAMIAQARHLAPDLPLVIGDGHLLPLQAGTFDLVAFIATLEFLADANRALVEAVRVARQGVIILALNRWSLGGLSRRYGRQRTSPILGQACDHSIPDLRAAMGRAASDRLRHLRWSCTLFPFLGGTRAPLPIGDVIGLAAELDGTTHAETTGSLRPSGGRNHASN